MFTPSTPATEEEGGSQSQVGAPRTQKRRQRGEGRGDRDGGEGGEASGISGSGVTGRGLKKHPESKRHIKTTKRQNGKRTTPAARKRVWSRRVSSRMPPKKPADHEVTGGNHRCDGWGANQKPSLLQASMRMYGEGRALLLHDMYYVCLVHVDCAPRTKRKCHAPRRQYSRGTL